MVLASSGRPLTLEQRPDPLPGPGEVRVRVEACGVCRTDLHVVDGELPDIRSCRSCRGTRSWASSTALGTGVDRAGASASASAFPGSATPAASAPIAVGQRENLCDRAGLHRLHAATAASPTHVIADARLCLSARRLRRSRRHGAAAVRRPDRLALAAHGGRRHAASASMASAPRPTSWRRSAAWQGREVYAFTRPGDARRAGTSRCSLGARWAGGSDERPPEPLDAAIIFAPVGALVPAALARCARAAASSAAAST